MTRMLLTVEVLLIICGLSLVVFGAFLWRDDVGMAAAGGSLLVCAFLLDGAVGE